MPTVMAHILLVDDEDALRSVLRRVLVREGHEVVEATNGREAMEQLRDKPFDLMITDLFMPQQDGLETILAVRRMQWKLPIIAISGGGSAAQFDMLRTATLFGAARVLIKPFRADEMLQAVREVLGGTAAPTPPERPAG